MTKRITRCPPVRMRALRFLPLALAALFLAGQDRAIGGKPADEKMLLPLDSTDGVHNTWGGRARARRCDVVRGAQGSTDGKGGVRLAASGVPDTGGNQYFGMLVPLPAPVDLRASRLLFDVRSNQPEALTVFYVRAYNRGERHPCLSYRSQGVVSADWNTQSLQAGVSIDGLFWETKMVEDRVPARVDRVEFIMGGGRNGSEIDVVVDRLRTAPRFLTVQELNKPRRLIPETTLVRRGVPEATVLHPDTDPGRAAAARVVEAVRARTGVTLPARAGRAADREPARAVVVLGNVENNPALQLLYARGHALADAHCPGPGGFVIQSVHDPFARGANAIVLGASDDAGLARAAAEFARVAGTGAPGADLVLGTVFLREYTGDFLKRHAWAMKDAASNRIEKGLADGRKALAEGQHTSIAGHLGRVASRYRLTRHSIEAKLFVALWDLYVESAKDDPRKMGGPWGFDSDFPSSEVVPGWDTIEEDPALNDAERLRVTRAMGRWLAEAVAPKCSGAASSSRVPHNHQTFPALGIFYAGLYYGAGLNTIEGRAWQRMADAIFRRQAGYFKPYEDCNGYQWLTNGHLMHYALARPDPAIFENGNGRRIIDYAVATMNNLGYQVPYGDTGSWRCWGGELACLDRFAFATGDPVAAWAAHLKRALQSPSPTPNAFQRPATPTAPPPGFDGVRVWPLEPQYVLSFRDDAPPPAQRLFDKISFRQSFDPDSAYLLLDGLGNGGHGHRDANAVLQLTCHGRIWLADNDYFKAQSKYHNSMLVFRDGASAPMPAYVALVAAGQSSRYGYSRTRIAHGAGVDWERAILWAKERGAFVVLDRLTAREPGEYQFRLLWHGIGAPALRSEGLLLTQNGPALWIQTSPGPELRLTDDADLGQNWKGYPHAEPVVRSLAAIARVRLRPGESYLYATALHGVPQGNASPWACRCFDGSDGVAFDTGDGPLAVAFGPYAGPVPGGSFDTDARLMVVDRVGLTLLGATHAEHDGTPLHTSRERADVDLDLPEARDTIDQIKTRTPTAAPPDPARAPAPSISWERGPVSAQDAAPARSGRQILHLATARVHGAAGALPDVVVAGADGVLAAFAADGSPLWSHSAGCALNDVAATDLDRDGRDEIILARQDHHVAALDATGKEIWQRELAPYRRPPYVNVVRTGDLDGDGQPEVIAGGENWRFHAFAGDGRELWHYESVHPSRSGAVGDIDGDGKAEVICGTHYYYVSTLKPDGTLLWRYSMGPICYDVTLAHLDAGPARQTVLGGGDGLLHVVEPNGRARWTFDTGDEVRRVAAGDLDGDGRDEILAGSMNHNVYCFGTNDRPRWRIDLRSPITALAIASAPGRGAIAVAGTDSGRLLFIDAAGRPLADTTWPGGIVDSVPHGDAVLVTTGDGTLRRVARAGSKPHQEPAKAKDD